MTRDDLVRDLRRLRRGDALLGARIVERIGPALAKACGVEAADDQHQVRTKVTSRILVGCSRLADHDALAVTVALGLASDCRFRFLKDRLSWLAVAIDRDSRTASRRVNNALELLAEVLSQATPTEQEHPEYAPDGWYVARLQCVLTVARSHASLLETRRIIATSAGLSQLSLAWAAPHPPSGEANALDVDLIYGGKLHRSPEATTGFWTGALQLPHPIAAGATHEFCVRVSVQQQVQPYLVVSALRRHDEFDLRVKFAPDCLPSGLWSVDGRPERFIDEGTTWGRPLPVDRMGEASVYFAPLRRGLCYGMRWINAE